MTEGYYRIHTLALGPVALFKTSTGHNERKNMTDKKTITISDAVERMITAVNIVTGDDGHRSQEAVRTFLELLKMDQKNYAKQQKFYG